MYAIICIRKKDYKEFLIPIMDSDEEGEPSDVMALWETFEEAQEFCREHILCKSSQNIIIDIDTADGIFEY